MRRSFVAIAIVVAGFAIGSGVSLPMPPVHAATSCTPTGYVKNAINLTAALVDPAGTVSGQVDATGCNIGVYYGPGTAGTVNAADIFGANYFGVVNNGGNVTIRYSQIHDIGDSPFSGDQYGVGIYFAYGSHATGSIVRNDIYRYQKGGIAINSSTATIVGNVVTGLGPIDFNAQNGIQFGYGASGSASDNYVSGNAYTGDGYATAAGILVVGGACYGDVPTTNITVKDNRLIGNDVGVSLSNLAADCASSVSTPTDNRVENNYIANDAINNVGAYGPGGPGYQAGIADAGTGDRLTFNTISGFGYTPANPPPAYVLCIDDSVSIDVHEFGNVCPGQEGTNSSHGSPGGSRRRGGPDGAGPDNP